VAPSAHRSPEILSGLGAAILDALPLSLYVVDRDLRVVAWNRARERGPIGKPRRRVLGRPLAQILTAEGYRQVEPILRRVFASGEAHEETSETRAGGRLYHGGRLPVVHGGKVSHVLAKYDDITERRALEMQVIASDRLAFLGQLVAGVAHEIANPLAGVAGCAEALASLALQHPEPAVRQEAESFRDLVRGEVGRCERLVKSLLETARPKVGEAADVAETVRSVLRLLERHPAFARVKVVSQMPDALPPAQIDPDSLRQVVLAVALNAGRAMKGSGTLRIRASRTGARLVLDLADNGPGVARAVRPHIFEPFFTTSPGEGSGLGLAIARSLLRRAGGDIVLVPRRARGACFRVVLKRIRKRT
jgi:two-component system, NtrC family, sensor kinase